MNDDAINRVRNLRSMGRFPGVQRTPSEKRSCSWTGYIYVYLNQGLKPLAIIIHPLRGLDTTIQRQMKYKKSPNRGRTK